MARYVHEQAWEPASLDRQDGGAAIVYHICDDEDTGLFVRFQSWDIEGKHEDFKQFEGRRIRVTVETVDD